MRTYLTYIALGVIGFVVYKLAGIELNLPLIFVGLVSIPLIEYVININHFRERANSERLRNLNRNQLYESIEQQEDKIENYASDVPTKPQSFGYKTNWLVVKSKIIDDVLNAFEYDEKVKTNWESGVNATFDNSNLKFVCPPINEWTIIVGVSYNYINSIESKSKLSKLSKIFGEVYYFGSFRGTGFATWAKYRFGIEERAFLVDDGDIFYSNGELEEEEIEILEQRVKEINQNDKEEVDYFAKHNNLNLLGDEDDVLVLAEKWTINPMKLHEFQNTELGYLIKEKADNK